MDEQLSGKTREEVYSSAAFRLTASRLDLRTVNWRLVAFWVALWWFIYTAPTEDTFGAFFTRGTDQFAQYDTTFE